ncbi:MAG: MBL fold metallo-hydrolase [Desulfobacterales bacterium]
MHVTFYGAVREVTGSMHLISTEKNHILLDCGMFQGKRKEANRKNLVLPFDPRIVTNMVLSHAHIDHSGRIPLLTKNNFFGRIISTRATMDACRYMLPDSAKIQESDAGYLNYKRLRTFLVELESSGKKEKRQQQIVKKIKAVLKKNRQELDQEKINDLIARHHIEHVEPLYSVEDAEQSLDFFDSYPYRTPITVGANLSCTLYEAGHILGSAISILKLRGENGRQFTICFSGDIGRFDRPILKDPTLNFEETDRNIDLMIMESTYGDRHHEPIADLKPRLAQILNETAEKHGTILIPSFAFGRTQELVYVLHEIYNENLAPQYPIYVDSPLATKITQVFGEHPELYDRETHKAFLEKGKNPFMFNKIHFVQSVEQSMALNRDETPHIVISASGMCEAGRILHHLRHKIHKSNTTILIVGYMAQNTLGRRLLEQGKEFEESGRKGNPPMLHFLGKKYPLKARVIMLGGFSAHGDRNEMTRWLKESNLNIKRIALVHGEEEQSMAFADHLIKKNYNAFVPKAGETISVT